ncbi:MAG TPA: hypothetical protein ENJ08_14585 [Gammaproteobacteria bacterium]|nr:hypothetical protein [Gammaproteobacteria bacterium]
MKLLIVLLLSLLAQACTTVGSLDRPEDYYQDSYYANRSSSSAEPILTDTTSLEDEKINSLLYERIRLPKQVRIAILKLSNDDYWRFYSDEFTQLNDSISNNLIDRLRASPRVYDASYLPSMLIPEKRTFPVLREAAARFQADILLSYRSSCDSFQKYRFISPDETKAYCTVEAMLLDTRKGIISKSVVSTQSFSAKKEVNDTDFSETIKKAELQALSTALGEVAAETVSYLKTAPLLDKKNNP